MIRRWEHKPLGHSDALCKNNWLSPLFFRSCFKKKCLYFRKVYFEEVLSWVTLYSWIHLGTLQCTQRSSMKSTEMKSACLWLMNTVFGQERMTTKVWQHQTRNVSIGHRCPPPPPPPPHTHTHTLPRGHPYFHAGILQKMKLKKGS